MAAIEQSIKVGNYIFESAQDNLVAAGSTQSGAFILGTAGVGSEINRFTTVTAGTGAQLPPAQPGLTIAVINHGANSLQVYGNGSDTINDVSGSTGVAQMANSIVLFMCTSAGAWYTVDLASGFASGFPTVAYANNLTAAGSVQSQATPITTPIAEFGTVAASTGGLLPPSAPGMQVTVINNGANTLKVYPSGTDQINALGTSAAFSMSTPPVVDLFYCTAAGQWWTK